MLLGYSLTLTLKCPKGRFVTLRLILVNQRLLENVYIKGSAWFTKYNEFLSSYCLRSWFYQWYQWYTNIVHGSTNSTIGNTIGTNGTIGKDRFYLDDMSK